MANRAGTFFAGLVLSIAAALFIIACATNEWATVTPSGPNSYLGLWDVCSPNTDASNCYTVTKDGDCAAGTPSKNIFLSFTTDSDSACEKFNVVRAFSVLAVCFSTLAAFSGLVVVAIFGNINFRVWTVLFAFVALASGLIAMGVFVQLTNIVDFSNWHYGYSFGLNVAAWPLALYGVVHFAYTSVIVE